VTDAGTSQAIADRTQITELIYRYCRAVDRLDVPLGHSIWHEDGWADYGPDVYQGPGKGVIDLICAQHLRALHHSHQVSNILIDLPRSISRARLCRAMSMWARSSIMGPRANGRSRQVAR
jgi:hypothetical protein